MWLLCCLAVSGSAAADSLRVVKLAANDLAYDPIRGKIYASVPGSAGAAGNSITVIDPVTGVVGPSIPAGPEPDRLALSDDGHYLYVGFDAASVVRRLDLRTGTMEAPIPLGSDPNDGPYYVQDLQVQPGHPDTIAIARQNHHGSPKQEGVAIYDNGVQRPLTTPAREAIDTIRFSPSAATLYGYGLYVTPAGFYTLAVDAAGVSIQSATQGLIDHFIGGIQFDDGWIFTNKGEVIDPGPPAARLIGSYPGVPFGSLVAPDAAGGRVYFLVQDGNSTQLLAFDRRTFAPVGSQRLMGAYDFPGRLIRWGADGLAFRTADGQVVLLETALIPTEPLSVRFDPASVIGGRPATGSVVLRGGAPAAGAVVTLAGADPAVGTFPPTVTVLPGATLATFPMRTARVPAATPLRVTARYQGLTSQATLTVLPPDLQSLSVSPARLIGGTPATGTITLSDPAPAGGLAIALSSADPAAQMPASVIVPAGAMTASFPIATSLVMAEKSVRLAAVFAGQSQSAMLQLLPLAIFSFTLKPPQVLGGLPSTATVRLAAPAPPGGAAVRLASSNPSVATVPAMVTIPAGALEATAPVTTVPVAAATGVKITAVLAASVQSATLVVGPPGLFPVALDPAIVTGGGRVTGTITLGGAAPAGGLVIHLSSSHPEVAPVPASVTVPAGTSSATFQFTTSVVPDDQSIDISATAGNGTLTSVLAVLSVEPHVAADSAFRLPIEAWDMLYDPFSQRIYASQRTHGSAASGSIVVIDPFRGTIERLIPVGGAPYTLALSDDGSFLYALLDNGASIARINLRAQTMDFQFTPGRDPRGNLYRAVNIAVLPGQPDALAVIRRLSSSLPGYAGVAVYDHGVPRPRATGPDDGTSLLLFSAVSSRLYGYDPEPPFYTLRRMTVDASGVTFDDAVRDLVTGQSIELKFDDGMIYSSTGQVIDPEAGVILAQFPGIPDGANGPPSTPASVQPDNNVGRAFFLSPGDGSAVKLLAYDLEGGQLAGSLTLPEVRGSPADLIRWGPDGLAFLAGSSFLQLVLLRTSLVPAPRLGVAFMPDTLGGGHPSTGRVTLPAPAPPGGASVALRSDSPAVMVPASVTVPAGATTATFPAVTHTVATDTTATITASFAGLEGSGRLTVLAPALATLAVDPGNVAASGPGRGVVTLTGPAAPGGFVVGLSSDRPGLVHLPAGVTVPAGATSASFPITVGLVVEGMTATITASAGEETRAAPLPLAPIAVASLSFNPSRVIGGEPSTGTVTLSRPAPVGGVPVTIRTEGTLEVIAIVTVPEGARAASFPVPTRPASFSGSLTFEAVLEWVQQLGQLEVLAPLLASMTVNPPSVTGGAPATGLLTLTGEAPDEGLPVHLASDDPALARVPDSITIPAGSRTVVFPIITSPAADTVSVRLTASSLAPLNPSAASALLQVMPPGLFSLTVEPPRVTGGAPATGTVTLTAAAPPGGEVVSLASSPPDGAGVPLTVTVPAGVTSASFPISTSPVQAETTVTITAAARGLERAATLTVVPAAPATSGAGTGGGQ